MEPILKEGAFGNASQRVASTYQRMLRPFSPVFPETIGEEQRENILASQYDLHAFFEALYDTLFHAPEQFGLPPAADIYLVVDHAKEGPDKTAIKRVLDRQRKPVEEGLIFLSAIGRQGRSENDTLVLDGDSPALDYLKKKPGRAWVNGLAQVGLAFSQTDGMVAVTSSKFPKMMPALQLLAESCASSENQDLGRVFFARCDFRAVARDFRVTPDELFRIFNPKDIEWAADLHAYFTARNYKAQVVIGRMFAWTVNYQGKKSIKASPLFQIDFDERLLNKMKAGIKCASAQRIVPLLPNQSPALQDDFSRRSFSCGNCHWCDNQKSLGPVEYEYHGEKRTICWYVNSDLDQFTIETADLVKEYAEMHEGLG